MQQINAFAREDDLPSWFANAVQFALSVLASQLKVLKADNTHVTVPAGANDQAAIVSIGGCWRWNEAPVTVAHPGGGAGLYPLFVTAAAQNVTSVPAPLTDHTTYNFGVEIDAPGAHPAAALYRHVADVAWDGTKITRVSQIVPASPLHASEHAVGGADPLSLADIGAAPSAWTNLALTGALARWTGGPGGDSYTPAVRTDGDRAELRGGIINHGATIASGGVLCTLALAFRPAHPVYPVALTILEVPCQLQILPSGTVVFFGPSFGFQSGDVLPLDNIGYSLL